MKRAMCGFVGIIGTLDPAAEAHLALQTLQHRGQDSAGIASMDAEGTHFPVRRGLGTVTQALGASELAALAGAVAIGHVRYPTAGRGVLEDTQPFFYRQPGVLMAHNGNITNYDELKEALRTRSIHLLSRCDIEPVLCEFAHALMAIRAADHRRLDVLEALSTVRRRVRGAYSVVAAMMLDGAPTLIVFRDPNGLRPAVVGQRRDGAFIAASESVALDVVGADDRFEPESGEVVFLRQGEAPDRHQIGDGQRAEPHPCIFEHVYFARPDATMNRRSVYEVRLAFGAKLAERLVDKGIAADVVVPVPDTSRPAAVAIAERMGVPQREGLIKNRYSGRTFIMPDQLTRKAALRLKLNPLPGELRGRRVLLVDDSIVRGTTLRRVVELVRDAGAVEVHLAIHSPPVRNPCYYGIDMSTEEELFARRFPADLDQLEPAAAIDLGADSLTFLSIAGLDAAFAQPRCAACFDGQYPQPVDDDDRRAIAGDRRRAADRT